MAITVEQLQVYQKYRGDEDGLSRAGTASEKALFSRGDWCRISNSVQSLALANSELASDELKAQTLDSVSRESANDAAVALLIELATPGKSKPSR